MATAATIEIDALLAPIPGDNPAGVDLRGSELFDKIAEARRAEDAVEQGDDDEDHPGRFYKGQVKQADWRAVVELSTEALQGKSKDLQIACWLTEALGWRHGFAGLRDGLNLVAEMLERFWDRLYPQLEDDDHGVRAGRIDGLDRQLPTIIGQLPMTPPLDGATYSWWQWKREKDAGASSTAFDSAAAGAPLSVYLNLYDDVLACLDAHQKLDALIDVKFGNEAPSLSTVKRSLRECLDLVEQTIKKKGGQLPGAAPQEQDQAEPGTGAPATPDDVQRGSVPFEPQNRADALRRLRAVAQYFKRAEPHSPVAALVERAVRWGEMPLDQWLEDVIKNNDVLGNVRETLGLEKSEK